ncbi:MAG: macro domain-containing protein [Gemmatimonadales bacterium]
MIHVVTGDLASIAADAVARPATTRLEPLTPALQRLDDAAGPKFVEQCRVRRELPSGAAVVTTGGDLPAEYVVHLILGAAADTVTTDSLARAVDAALWQCTQWQISTLACPVPAAGNVASDAAARVLLEAIQRHMRRADHPATVLIVTANDSEHDLVAARIGKDES